MRTTTWTAGSDHGTAAAAVALLALSLLLPAPGAAGTESRYTPVVLSVIEAPRAVVGSDASTHLVYELLLTNASMAEWRVREVAVTTDDGRQLEAWAGDRIAGQMVRLGDRTATDRIEPGGSTVFFIHLAVPEGATVPKGLLHRVVLTMPGGIPPGLARFASLPEGTDHLTEHGAATPVVTGRAVVLGPPLAGDRWIAADGCCTAARHVRTFMSFDGRLFLAQRFAIDWERMDGERRLFVGDPADPESYFAYDEVVLAGADASVVAAVDGLPDQVPGGLPPGLPMREADGNHVILDLGDDRFALYAHLRPGSVRVSEGEKVRRGQVLGRVGNSGNTTAPHLHFHVMSSPSPLGSNGLPYVFDRFATTGQVASTEAFDRAEAEGIPLEMGREHPAEEHRDQLPLDQRVVVFPPAPDVAEDGP